MGIQDTIKRVHESGDARRRVMKSTSVWMPAKDSTLWESYVRFCRETGRTANPMIGRCIFYELVIMSYLRWLAKKLSSAVSPSVWGVLGTIVGAVLLEWFFTWVFRWWLFPVIVGVILVVVTVVLTFIAYVYLKRDDRSLRGLVHDILPKKAKISIGIVWALLMGPLVLAELAVLFIIHHTFKLIFESRPVRFLRKHIDGDVLLVILFVIVVCFFAYVGPISHLGWLWGTLAVLAFVGGVAVVIGVVIGGVFVGSVAYEAVDDYRQDRRTRRIEAGLPVRMIKPKGIIRKSFQTVGGVLRLFYEMGLWGYKSICELVPVPEEVLAKVNAEEAEAKVGSKSIPELSADDEPEESFPSSSSTNEFLVDNEELVNEPMESDEDDDNEVDPTDLPESEPEPPLIEE